MKNTALISIIVPVYNRAHCIKKCLNNLIKQTYKNIEIICINDGSTDDSLSILQQYAQKDTRIKLLNNPKNMGIAYSRNKGLDTSTGEYIMWCDSDDWYETTMCEKMLKAITKDKDIDIAECSSRFVFANDLTTRKYLNNRKSYNCYFSGICPVNNTTLNEIRGFLWNKIFKKSTINKYNLRFESIPTHEDFIFTKTFAILSNKICFIQEKLYNYSINELSTIDKIYKQFDGIVSDLELFYYGKYVPQFLRKHNLPHLYPLCNDFFYRLAQSTANDYKHILQTHINFINEKTKTIYGNIADTKCVMNIFFSCDNNYTEHLATTLTSILYNANEFDEFNIYIIDGGISFFNKLKLASLKKIKPFFLEFITVNKKDFSSFPIKISYMTQAIYYRYLIPQIKPNLKRILYLDCDTIVKSSLRELYNMDFSDNYVIATKDTGWSKFAQKYKIKDYFNSGVLLINNEKWVKDNIAGTLFTTTYKLLDDLEGDQDILNYVFKDKVKIVSDEYNYQFNSLAFSNITNLSEREQKAYIYEPTIIHYSGKEKPWTDNCIHPFVLDYFKYKKLSPFRKKVKQDLQKYWK